MPHTIRPNLHRFLERLTSRSVLTEEEQQAVLNLPGHAEQVPANVDFVRLGDRVDHACMVVAGMAGRFDQTREGKRQITALHIPGDMCDLHSVVQPVTASALQALAVTTIVRVPHGAIKAVAERYPALAQAFWRDCTVDAAILSQWMVNVGRRNARSRVAHLLCETATRLGAASGTDDVMFDFPLTQEHLAEATALTPVHINRTLQSLRAEKLVEWRSRQIRLPNWDALAEVGDFDPSYLQLEMELEQPLRIVHSN